MTHFKKIEFGSTSEAERREREIQLRQNVIQPDPEYQAFFVSDEATVLDITGSSPELIRARLESYFAGPLDIDLRTPLPQLVDLLKSQFPSWPDDWPPEHS